MPELLVVATPIGNLSDLSERMKEALASCDLIAAEDTRVTMKLLAHLGLKKPLVASHRHNEADRAQPLIERMLAENLTVALTCDAGTPGISDPGVPLVRAALAAGIRVTPVCGPSAFTAHLSASGFDARRFAFFGFPPREKKALLETLEQALKTGIPVAVFYESPHRVVALCRTIAQTLPEARLSVACDLSKKYEKILTGEADQVCGALEENPNVEKGEYCVLVDLSACPRPAPQMPELSAEARLLLAMLDGQSLPDAAAGLSDVCPRNELYRAKLAVRQLIERASAQQQG